MQSNMALQQTAYALSKRYVWSWPQKKRFFEILQSSTVSLKCKINIRIHFDKNAQKFFIQILNIIFNIWTFVRIYEREVMFPWDEFEDHLIQFCEWDNIWKSDITTFLHFFCGNIVVFAVCIVTFHYNFKI